MNKISLAYEQLTETIAAWARTRPDIHAAIVAGSGARADYPSDGWSDLDIILIVEDPKPYLSGIGWLRNIGDFWIMFLEPTAIGGGMERRVLFDGGLDVDFSIIPHAKVAQMAKHGFPREVAGVFRRGTRVLLVRDGLATLLNPAYTESPSPRPLTRSEFLELASDFFGIMLSGRRKTTAR